MNQKCLWCKGSGYMGVLTDDDIRKLVIEGKGEQSLKDYAKKLKVSFQFLGKVIAGIYKPGPTIAAALGFEQMPKEIYYRKASGKKERPKLPKEGWRGVKVTKLKKRTKAATKPAKKKKASR
jgi:hypothetical protein